MSEPAIAVFRMLQAARELKFKEQAEFMYELCGIAAIPSQSKDYIQSLQASYKKMSDHAVPEHAVSQKKPKNGAISWKHASALMSSAMKIKKKLESRGR